MHFNLIREGYRRIYNRDCTLTDNQIESVIKGDSVLGPLYRMNSKDLSKFCRNHLGPIVKVLKKVEGEFSPREFDIYFIDPETEEERHEVVTALYMGDAVNYVESRLGGAVYKAVMRRSEDSREKLGFMHLK